MADFSYEPGGVNVLANALALGVSVTGLSMGLPAKNTGDITEYTWTIKYSAAPTAPDVRLQGSLDDITYFDLDTYTGTTDTMRHVISKPVRYLRVFYAAGSGANVTVKVYVR